MKGTIHNEKYLLGNHFSVAGHTPLLLRNEEDHSGITLEVTDMETEADETDETETDSSLLTSIVDGIQNALNLKSETSANETDEDGEAVSDYEVLVNDVNNEAVAYELEYGEGTYYDDVITEETEETDEEANEEESDVILVSSSSNATASNATTTTTTLSTEQAVYYETIVNRLDTIAVSSVVLTCLVFILVVHSRRG